MKKLLLTLMLSIVSSGAMAEWVEAGSYNGYDPIEITAYADPASIRKVGDIVTMRIMIDYKPVEIVEMVDGKQQKLDSKQQKLVSGKAESEELQAVFDCKEAQSQSISSEWEGVPVSPDSMDEGLWKIACGKVTTKR